MWRTSPMVPPPHCRCRCPPPPRLGGKGRQGEHQPPSPKSVRWSAPPAAGTSLGCPSWCLEQRCCTPPPAPCMTCTRGPCARRTGSAWGVAAPPSSLQPAALAAVCRSTPMPVRPRRAPVAPPGPLEGAIVGRTMGGGGGGWCLPRHAACPSPVQHSGGGGGARWRPRRR